LRILILDDDRSYGALLASASKKLGHRAIVKVDAQEAVQMLRNGEADIALVDLDMPNGTGTAFAKTLRKNGITVPVAFCTGTCRDMQLIEEAQSMGQVLPKIWTHADLRVILSALQLESNSVNRIRSTEEENSEITEPEQRGASLADGSNEHARQGSYAMPVSADSSQDLSRQRSSSPVSGEYSRPSSREILRPSSREISRAGAREDLRTPHDLRSSSGEMPAPLAPSAAPDAPRPGGKHAGGLSAKERSRAQAPTAAPPPGGLPPAMLDLAPEPLDLVDAIPPPMSPPPLELSDPPPLELSDPPPLELGDIPPLELDDPYSADSPPTHQSTLDPHQNHFPSGGPLPAVPLLDDPQTQRAPSSMGEPSVGPLDTPDPFQGSTTSPQSGEVPVLPKKRLDTMLEVGEALRETPRVNIGCSSWDQVRRLCGDVMRGMTTITVRARCEMRAGEDVVVALELPDEMVVSIGARVLDFRERSSDGKRPYQLDLVGFGSDEIAYLLGSCDANSSAPQKGSQSVKPAPVPAPPPVSTAQRTRSAAPVAPPPKAAKPSALPPGISIGAADAGDAVEAETNDRQMPAIPDAIDAVDAETSFEEKGPSISWS
jgi:CheY-like chemotaxis protein